MAKQLIITTINIDAFQATGHVLPSAYTLELTDEQKAFIQRLSERGESIDRVYISTEEKKEQ